MEEGGEGTYSVKARSCSPTPSTCHRPKHRLAPFPTFLEDYAVRGKENEAVVMLLLVLVNRQLALYTKGNRRAQI